MRQSASKFDSRLWRAAMWLGSVQFAVPVLALVAIALGVGTFLESTQNVRIARQYVYGASWFIGVMVLMCVSLTFAVVSRYPWKRRHIGFITVHAGLVGLVVAGFWSMIGRIDGHLALEEGTMSSVVETEQEQLEVLQHNAGKFDSLESVPGPDGAMSLTLAGVSVQVLERWENSRDEEFIADDSPLPLRAIEIAPMPGPQTLWVGQEDQAGPAPTLMGLKVLVLPEGSAWSPPSAAAEAGNEYVFVVGAERFVLRGVGDEALPGWKIIDLKRFERAVVTGDTIVEGPAGSPRNAAVQVKISDGKGTTEQHTAFENFADLVMGKPLEGSGNSASRLVAGGLKAEPETLVVFGTVGSTQIGYIGLDGKGRVIPVEQKYPMVLNLASREVRIMRQLARAHQSIRTVKMPVAKDNRPALLVRIGDGTELRTISWKGMVELTTADNRLVALHFGPRRVQLPFTVRLADFRKTDYPGTEMAMAYQSDVGLSIGGGPEQKYEIYMNHPFKHGPWKVYQSGFMGEQISVFSVMRDPGLGLTYISSVVLCLGVFITFYSRSLSGGHPGIPAASKEMESGHGSSRTAGRSVHASPVHEAVGGV